MGAGVGVGLGWVKEMSNKKAGGELGVMGTLAISSLKNHYKGLGMRRTSYPQLPIQDIGLYG